MGRRLFAVVRIFEVAKTLKASGRPLILCAVREQPAKLLHEAVFEELIGKENLCDNVQEVVARAKVVFEKLEVHLWK